MEQLMQAFLAILKRAGFTAVRQMPQGVMPRLKGPVVAVSLAALDAAQMGFFEYLGKLEREGNIVPLYGKRLRAEVLLQVVSPEALGAERCAQEAEKLCTKLSEQLPGIVLTGFSAGPCSYDKTGDFFLCEVKAKASAYLYAEANEEETEFTDFILKGAVQ